MIRTAPSQKIKEEVQHVGEWSTALMIHADTREQKMRGWPLESSRLQHTVYVHTYMCVGVGGMWGKQRLLNRLPQISVSTPKNQEVLQAN